MKLVNILKENASRISFAELNPRQVSVLVRMYKNEFDYDAASPGELAVVDTLRDVGLIDDQYELTPGGAKAGEYGARMGSVDRREAGVRDNTLGRTGGAARPYGSDGIDDIEEPDSTPFRNRWEDVRNVD